MLKLPARELPLLTIRKALPSFLAGGGECFIEVDARPGGPVNPAFLAAQDKILLSARTRMRLLGKIDDDTAHVAMDREYAIAIARERLAAVYDTCIIAWRSNILNGDAPIDCTRDNFLDLAAEHVPALGRAMVEIDAEIMAAGKAMEDETEAVRKN